MPDAASPYGESLHHVDFEATSVTAALTLPLPLESILILDAMPDALLRARVETDQSMPRSAGISKP